MHTYYSFVPSSLGPDVSWFAVAASGSLDAIVSKRCVILAICEKVIVQYVVMVKDSKSKWMFEAKGLTLTGSQGCVIWHFNSSEYI